MAYSNVISLVTKYTAMLDEVYKEAAKTAVLASPASIARQGVNANEIAIPKISMDGLGDYSRNSGFVDGNVSLTYETVQFNYDRGRMFQVDAMDDEETIGVAFGKLSSEFIRTKVVPEKDAFTFAQLAGATGISAVDGATLATGADVIAALRAAANTMDEDEVPMEGRILFITPTLYGLIADLDTTKSREVLAKFSKVVEVPQSRFYTAIDLLDGTTSGETGGGFQKAFYSQKFEGDGATKNFTVTAKPAELHSLTVDGTAVTTGFTYTAATGVIAFTTAPADDAEIVANYGDGRNINFMVVHPSAVIKFDKHTVNKTITPEQNQHADAWKFGFRAYSIVETYENKTAGIYLHKDVK